MDSPATTPASIALPCAVDLPPDFRLTVEIVAGQVVIRIGHGTGSTAADQGAKSATPVPAARAEALAESLPAIAPTPCTGREVAERIAAERGDGALLKFSEWDELLPRSVVRRGLKRALKDGRLSFKSKGTNRDGRAKTISARAMADFLAKLEDGKQ